jgi:hypothetical protein
MIRCFDTTTALYLSSFYQVDSTGNTLKPGGGGSDSPRSWQAQPIDASEKFLLVRRATREAKRWDNQEAKIPGRRRLANRSFNFTSVKSQPVNWRKYSPFFPSRVVAFYASLRHPAFKVLSLKELRVTDPFKRTRHLSVVSVRERCLKCLQQLPAPGSSRGRSRIALASR